MFSRYRRNNNNGASGPTPTKKYQSSNGNDNTTNNNVIQSAEEVAAQEAAQAASSLQELNIALNRLEYLTDKIAPKVTKDDEVQTEEDKNNNNAAARRRYVDTAAGTMRGSTLLIDDLSTELSTSPSNNNDNDETISKNDSTTTDSAADIDNNNIQIAIKQQQEPQEQPKVIKRSPSATASDKRQNTNAHFLNVSIEDEIEIVELLRRIAELVVLSERKAGQLLNEVVVVVGEGEEEEEEEEEDDDIEHDDEGGKEEEDVDNKNVEGTNNNDEEDGESSGVISTSQQSKGESTEEKNGPDKQIDSTTSTKTIPKKRKKKKTKAQQQQEHNEDLALPYLAIFELFCERNGLANIVNIVTGVAFKPPDTTTTNDGTSNEIHKSNEKDGSLNNNNDKSTLEDEEEEHQQQHLLPPLSIATQAVQSISILIQNVSRATSLYFLLSNNRVNDLIKLPLHLYEKAERNAINDVNSRRNNSSRKSSRGKRGQQQQQQQQQVEAGMSELSTHFVSFLKSLAMRVNAETLQFFLSFPLNENNCTKDEDNVVVSSSNMNGEDNDETYQTQSDAQRLFTSYLERRKVVEFPLYSRALEFCCQEQQDSFVRVTAMNVCMNIIRLVTIHSENDEDYDDDEDDDETVEKKDVENGKDCEENGVKATDKESKQEDSESEVSHIESEVSDVKVGDDDDSQNQQRSQSLPTATPSGILHEAPTLPLQDRIAIAQYACHPKRVNNLVAPLCARLTSQFGQVEGTVRALEESYNTVHYVQGDNNSASKSSATKKTTPAQKKNSYDNIEQERTHLRNTIQDLIANVQDELLLLDDLLKVGLISLNEQAIEMMFATFVYPMLLQPLLLPLHRFSSSKSKSVVVDETASSSKDVKMTKPVITLQSPVPFSSSTLTNDDDAENIDSKEEAESTTPQSIKGEESLNGETSQSTKSNGPTAQSDAPADTDSTDKPPKYSSCDMDLAPSKTALFGLSVIFHTVSNPTFRHLLLTALLHPLSPVASGGVVINAPPQITLPIKRTKHSSNDDFELEIRMERNQARYSRESEEFQRHVNVYTFGTEPGGSDHVNVEFGSSCVFILAPALVDMLRNNTCMLTDGLKDMQISQEQTTPKTRLNPYRTILLSAIAGSDEMVSLQPLAIAALHAAVSLVDSSIVQKIMFPSIERRLPAGRSSTNADDVVEETLQCLCRGMVNTLVTYDGWWKIKFNTVAAQTLMDVIAKKHDYIRTAETMVGDIRMKAAEFLMTLPSHLDGKSRDGDNKKMPDHLDHWLLDRFFFDQSDKYTNSVVENLCYLKEKILDDDTKEQYRYGLEVLSSITIMKTSALLCEHTCVVDNMLVVADARGNTPFHCAASWALVSLYLDAFCVKLSKMSSAFGEKGQPRRRLSFISANVPDEDIPSQMDSTLAHISSKFAIAMLDEGESSDKKTIAPAHGSAVGLIGKTAFPCVCEVSSTFSSLFTGRTCISNEGIQWQSLYLVVVGKWAVLAEPGHGGTGGEGRVITACRLACLAVKKDTSALGANNKTPARRLLVAHASLDPRPPSLFLVDSSSRRGGPNLGPNGLRLTRSRMDLWFEDANAAGHACKILSSKIAKARAKRGSRIGTSLLGK